MKDLLLLLLGFDPYGLDERLGLLTFSFFPWFFVLEVFPPQTFSLSIR